MNVTRRLVRTVTATALVLLTRHSPTGTVGQQVVTRQQQSSKKFPPKKHKESKGVGGRPSMAKAPAGASPRTTRASPAHPKKRKSSPMGAATTAGAVNKKGRASQRRPKTTPKRDREAMVYPPLPSPPITRLPCPTNDVVDIQDFLLW